MIAGEVDLLDCHLAIEMGVPLHEVRSWPAGDVAELEAFLGWREHVRQREEAKARGG